MTDRSSVRYCDGENVFTIAGCNQCGFADGTGVNARFSYVLEVVCTRDRKRLFVADDDNLRVRTIDIDSKVVRTLAGNGQSKTVDEIGRFASFRVVHSLVFDRSRKIAPESVLWVSAAEALRRIDIQTTRVSTFKLELAARHKTWIDRIHSTASGHLLCTTGFALLSVDTTNGAVHLMAGELDGRPQPAADGPGLTARLSSARGIAVIDAERCAYLCDFNSLIRRISLPSHLFS